MVKQKVCSRLQQYAAALKVRATKPERELYPCLEILKRELQIVFEFQKPLALGHRNAILDFYCPLVKLAIEVDGGYHGEMAQRERDQERTDLLFSLHGIRVLRLPNALVLDSQAKATELILAEVLKLCRLKVRNRIAKALRGRAVERVIADGFARYPSKKLHCHPPAKTRKATAPQPSGVVHSNYFTVTPEQVERERKAFEKHLRKMERKDAGRV